MIEIDRQSAQVGKATTPLRCPVTSIYRLCHIMLTRRLYVCLRGSYRPFIAITFFPSVLL